MTRCYLLLLAAWLILIFAGVVAVGALTYAYLSSAQGFEERAEVELVIPPGASAREVVDLLDEAGIVRPSWMFLRVLQLSGVGRRVQAGDYRFQEPLSPRQVLTLLSTGQDLTWPVTIREGLDLVETAELFAKHQLAPRQQLLDSFRNPALVADLDATATDLEGYLYPETYQLPKQYPPDRIAEVMVRTLRQQFVEPREAQIAASGLTLRQIVTLASLVEKETGQAAERARIAGVFLERLDRGMRLQCDPTIIYALKLEGRWDGNIRRRDLTWDHPYNTYVHRGLPPGPIAAPGIDALVAVLEPERTGDLYFVARGDGTHVFSRTLREHQRAVRKFQLRR